MPNLVNKFSRYFADKPLRRYICPRCKKGSLVPDQESFKVTEPPFSKAAHGHYEWEPSWIDYRFTYSCVCDRNSCGEIAYVSGSGSVYQRYAEDYETEHYDGFEIRSFFPAPDIIQVPEDAPREVSSLLEKSFSLYWVDVSAAANALRASLEVLLDELHVPRTQKNKNGDTVPISLHRRLDIWSQSEKEYAELCLALKEVGNLGSHGETVREKHYFGAMEIFAHVLLRLFENDAKRMKELAKKIRSEIKGTK